MSELIKFGWKFVAGGLIVLFIGIPLHTASITRLHAEAKQASDDRNKNQIATDAASCLASQVPNQQSDDYAKKQSDALLATCLSKLRARPTACVPVYIPAAPGGSVEACKQPTGGINLDQIEASNIEWQQERNELNELKIWAVGTKKYYDDWKAGRLK